VYGRAERYRDKGRTVDVLTDHGDDAPRNRSECKDGFRPCPWFRCRYNLYLTVTPRGSIVANYPDIAPENIGELVHTCALDIADAGAHSLAEIGNVLGVTREAIRMVEGPALRKLRAAVQQIIAARDAA